MLRTHTRLSIALPTSPQLQSGTSNYPAQEPRMIPTKELSPVEFAVVYVKNKKSGREQMRFLPRCCYCRKILLDISEANLAAVDCEKFKLEPIGSRGDLEIYQQSGRALVFCWDCDRKKNRVPWQAALGTFRGLDEPQRFPSQSARERNGHDRRCEWEERNHGVDEHSRATTRSFLRRPIPIVRPVRRKLAPNDGRGRGSRPHGPPPGDAGVVRRRFHHAPAERTRAGGVRSRTPRSQSAARNN